MQKVVPSSDEVIIKAVKKSEKRQEPLALYGPQCWATLKEIRRLLPNEPRLEERLRQLAASGKLSMKSSWQNHARTDITGVSPAVGFSKKGPRFRVLRP